jgi:hypothetical protein
MDQGDALVRQQGVLALRGFCHSLSSGSWKRLTNRWRLAPERRSKKKGISQSQLKRSEPSKKPPNISPQIGSQCAWRN